ncbi:MAG: cytidine deaminase [Mycoplasma sp.]|nr:cytidine deaminase [Mycoplasma sp.]
MKKELINLLKNSYAPFSNVKVASIVIDTKGNKWLGTNVEPINLSSICAERNAIFTAIANGEKQIKEVNLISSLDKIYPCGACLQIISEFIIDKGLIKIFNLKNDEIKIFEIDDLLPYSIKGLI